MSAQFRFKLAEPRDDKAAREGMPRVDRDPCARCGVRADVGCDHRRVRFLSVVG